jgi:heparanase 1
MRTPIPSVGVAAALAALVSVSAQTPALEVGKLPRIGEVDPRFVSYNVEMVEVTGGRFWAPYRAESEAEPPAPQQGGAPPGLDPSAFRMRPPLDLSSARLRTLAKALGPAYMRVSGTWANSTYFHDADSPAPAKPPEGYGGVLTRAQWRGVVEFAKATDAKVVTSFAISPGTRDDAGVWTSTQAQRLLAYTDSIGGSIAAAEFFNEPNIPAMGGAPKDYDAAAFRRDIAVFVPFIRKAAPDLIVLGPGSVGEGGLMADFPGVKSEAMLSATGPVFDVVSYHSYGAVSKRCAGVSGGIGQRTPEEALSEDWLSRAGRDARYYATLRDEFLPGKPLWLTESGETACGGNPWASTFVDTFRYVEQLGRLATIGVQVVMHNTLSASDYAFIDEETLEPRPSYWAALLWNRLMGTTVLDAGEPPAPGVNVYAHCSSGGSGGVTLVAVNNDRDASGSLSMAVQGERYTLASPTGLESHQIELNGTPLALGDDGKVPALDGVAAPAGGLSLPPASITFVTLPGAQNGACAGNR